mmetsp:Transcript_69106/g.136674  ORF Transcript_69106/g.136674 Transcript_69106/m.136674 type:complete len:221 (-) Transcript_69106:1229-1891(-)
MPFLDPGRDPCLDPCLDPGRDPCCRRALAAKLCNDVGAPRSAYRRCSQRSCLTSSTSKSSRSSSSARLVLGDGVGELAPPLSGPFLPWQRLPTPMIPIATRALLTESTAANFDCPIRPASTKAWLETKSATVSPIPASADIAKRSNTVTRAGRPKPNVTASRLHPATPSVFPTISAKSTLKVNQPTLSSLTPAFANPKKNMPKSTGNLRSCSSTCRGASW